jgi:hypothetical protein
VNDLLDYLQGLTCLKGVGRVCRTAQDKHELNNYKQVSGLDFDKAINMYGRSNLIFVLSWAQLL